MPSRDISTACAWRSWCGANLRRTPAAAATRCSSARIPAGPQGWPRVGPRSTQNRAPTGRLARCSSHGPLVPAPAVHADLAALAALPVPDQHGTAAAVQIAFGQRERFADPQSGAPEHDDDGSQPNALRPVAAGAHHGDDLLDAGRVRRVAAALVAGRAPLVKAGQGRRRAAPSGAIQQRHRFHDVLLWTRVYDPDLRAAPSRSGISATPSARGRA